MQIFKTGVIGTGFGGKVEAPIFNSHEGFEVVAISSITGRNPEDVKKISGVETVYTNWKKMLEYETLDLVIVASAVYLHQEMVQAAFEKGIHVMCEKPMALDTAETEKMVAARDQGGKWGFINHEFRFLPARMKVKELIDEGNLGNLMHVRYICTHPIYTPLTTKRRGWLGEKEKGGGLLNALGSHMVDAIHWWTNSQIKTLFANLFTHVPEYQDENGAIEYRTADDAFQVIGSLANNATVTMELFTATKQAGNKRRLEVFGEKGTLVMLDDNQVFFASEGASLEEVSLSPDLTAPVDLLKPAVSYYNSFKRMLDALYESLMSGNKHIYLADFENGQTTQKVIDAIHVSSSEGKKVLV